MSTNLTPPPPKMPTDEQYLEASILATKLAIVTYAGTGLADSLLGDLYRLYRQRLALRGTEV